MPRPYNFPGETISTRLETLLQQSSGRCRREAGPAVPHSGQTTTKRKSKIDSGRDKDELEYEIRLRKFPSSGNTISPWPHTAPTPGGKENSCDRTVSILRRQSNSRFGRDFICIARKRLGSSARI